MQYLENDVSQAKIEKSFDLVFFNNMRKEPQRGSIELLLDFG